MPKYYIRSGSVMEVISAENSQGAVVKVLKKLMDKGDVFDLGLVVGVSERGFNSIEYIYDTAEVLKSSGIGHRFKIIGSRDDLPPNIFGFMND